MAANWSILELMTSPFGSESMKYYSSKVLLEAKLPIQNFLRNLCQRDFASDHVGQIIIEYKTVLKIKTSLLYLSL